MKLDFLDRLVCPHCKGRLVLSAATEELVCPPCRLGFEAKGRLPNMLVRQARKLSAQEVETLLAPEHPGAAAAEALRDAQRDLQ